MCGYMGGVATEASTSSQALTSTTSGGKTPEATQESHLDANIGHGHVLKMLELFQEQNSLRSFSRSVEVGRAIGGDLNPGNESRTVATNLVKVCAGHEWYVNRSLLMNCSIWGLGQDGKDKALLVASRMVLWTLPKPMRINLPSGVTALLPVRFGSKGPWVAERALGCEELGSDRGGEALAAATLNILKTTLPEPDDFKAVAKKGKFFTADNAADETIAHKCLRDELNALEFDIPHNPLCYACHQERLQRRSRSGFGEGCVLNQQTPKFFHITLFAKFDPIQNPIHRAAMQRRLQHIVALGLVAPAPLQPITPVGPRL